MWLRLKEEKIQITVPEKSNYQINPTTNNYSSQRTRFLSQSFLKFYWTRPAIHLNSLKNVRSYHSYPFTNFYQQKLFVEFLSVSVSCQETDKNVGTESKNLLRIEIANILRPTEFFAHQTFVARFLRVAIKCKSKLHLRSRFESEK